jgi:hypothetical protein
MAVTADHHVDSGRPSGQARIVAVAKTPVLTFLQTAVAETDDHIDLLRLAEDCYHLLGGLDGVGERNSTSASGVELGLFAEQAEEAEADAAALDHQMAAGHPLLGQVLEIGQGRVGPREVGIRGEQRRNPAGVAGYAD